MTPGGVWFNGSNKKNKRSATAAPTTGLGADPSYGVATIEINGEPLPKDEFDSDSHQFTIQADSDTTVNIEFRKKESIYFFLWEEGETYIEYVDANITSGYEKNEIYLPLNEPDDTLPSGDFAGIPGADLRIEILNAETEVPDATLKYLYIVRGRDGTEILDCVELKDGKGTLEIQTTVTDNEFSLVATSTQPQTNQTE